MAVRAILLLKKLNTLTDEEFFKYVEGQHTDLILKCPIVKEKVTKFSQLHVDKALSSNMAASGLQIVEFDCEVNFWCASMEDLMAMFSDPEWKRTVVADGPAFHKVQEARLMIGHDKDFIADGKVL